MPNYKIFQDFADSLRVKIYGVDESNNTTPLLTDASGKMSVTGNVEVSGQVSGTVDIGSGTVGISGQVSGIVDIGSGSVEISGQVSGIVDIGSGSVEISGQVSGTVGISGQVSGIVDIGSGSVEISGQVSGIVDIGSGSVEISGQVSGTVDIGSGTVKVDSGVEVSGIVNTSGAPLFVRGAIVDSGPVSSGISGQISGAFGGEYWDVLGYRSWTFAVKYSGASGANVTSRLQISATGSGADWINVDPSASNYSGITWNLFATTYQLRYARIYFINDSGAEGDMQLYFQSEY
ncbi:MAG: polymer-forming cytoskeletal protein [Syntrophomonadaceae bacterium]|nr:polymer-forming cytoskeletal protein [Syntrophomonadaceae bacterium]